ncbi:hypothetical protein ACO0LF_07345 [Undibacterium sp. Di27W]|uniref:hypothetical protein n=1 Tax=Undibacterium sp. Di27W TaxID=3413036 RepID=UPI003BF19F9E
MSLQKPAVCPECGFGIFNRRYPKCEKCGIALPDTLVMPKPELLAIQKRERQEEELTAELKKQLARRESRPQSGDSDYFYFDGGSAAGSADYGSGGGDCSA